MADDVESTEAMPKLPERGIAERFGRDGESPPERTRRGGRFEKLAFRNERRTGSRNASFGTVGLDRLRFGRARIRNPRASTFTEPEGVENAAGERGAERDRDELRLR